MQESIRENIFDSALDIVRVKGWAPDTLEQASEALGLHISAGQLIFPYGSFELIEFLMESIDNKMLSAYSKLDMKEAKIHERILTCLKLRFEILAEYRQIMQKTVSFLAQPWHAAFASKLAWHVADIIWYEAGNDKAVDFNYYTKRSLLSAIYVSALLYWVNDHSQDYIDTSRFMDRRIEDVLCLGRLVKKMHNFL